jgi:hypothetical protein
MGVLRLLRADKQTHLSYLTNPAISYDEMRAAGMGTDRAEHMSVVLNPACTADVISLISRNSDGYVQAWAARCKNVPEGVLVSLSKDPDSSLRHAAAISSRTPTYILEQLSRDKYPSVREAVAGNKNAPVAVLRTLSTDVDPHVSYRAARNEAATVDIRIRELQKYSRPHELYLLSRLAHEHPGTTPPPHPAICHMRSVVMVSARESTVGATPVEWPENPRSIYELPGHEALPRTIDQGLDPVDKKPLSSTGLSVNVIRSKRELERNAEYMGNCTAGYADRVSTGDSIILALRDPEGRTVVNAELRRKLKNDGPGWDLGEVNSRYNGGEVGLGVHEALKDLVDTVTS